MKKGLSLYRRMLSFMVPYTHWFVISTAISIFIVILDAFTLWILASLLSTLFTPDAVHISKPAFDLAHLNEFLKYYVSRLISTTERLQSLKLLCLITLGSYILKNVLTYIHEYLVTFINYSIIRDMRNLVYRHSLELPVSYYDRNRSASIVSLIINDISQINYALTGTLNTLLIDPIRLVCFVCLLFIISPILASMLIALYPVFIILIVVIGKTVRRRSHRTLNQFEGLISLLSEIMNGVRIVKVFGTQLFETKRFRTENSRLTRLALRSAAISFLSSPLTETLGMFMAVLLLWFAGREVLSGNSLTGEDFLRFMIILVSSYAPFKRLARMNNTLQQGFAAANRTFKILDSSTESLTVKAEASPDDFSRDIVYKNVSFTYPGSSDEVLHNVSFRIDKGNIVALVGSSGGGKSTILDLLPRFYDVQEGRIAIDGADIQSIDLISLRSMFGIVSQETILFDDTVRANIAYGNAHALDADIEAAANSANALEFIRQLPKGMDTVIGERGAMLSGGQRQRLAIARALLRNPPILILDEATSALDTESERLVQNAINNLIENRTALVVAHRLSTILHADNILVIENGSIVEQGKHADLLEREGRYKYLYDIQFGLTGTDTETPSKT